ncbi:hypothetical protein Ancab_013418 [Ancistrocladus abbreviatus]
MHIYPSIVKDNVKVQYYTSFLVGTPSVKVKTVIDKSVKYSETACDTHGYSVSSTFRPIPCGTAKCIAYDQDGCVGCNMPVAKPSCTNNTCGGDAYTPWSRGLYTASQIEDTISLYSCTPNSPISKTSLRNFPFTCAISSTFKVPHILALCFPSSSTASYGAMYFGVGPYYLPPSRIDLTKYLATTPVIINPVSTAPLSAKGEPSIEYFIKVRSIKVDGIPVPIKPSLLSIVQFGNGGTKRSTLTSYTTLQSDICKALVGVFASRAEARKITRVASVAPFGACFISKCIAPAPIIDLGMENNSPVLLRKNARWRIYGAYPMVKVSPEVSCLGFVDGGWNARTTVIIGGQRMEDNFIEFDLAYSQLLFTSSLLHFDTSCSQFSGL